MGDDSHTIILLAASPFVGFLLGAFMDPRLGGAQKRASVFTILILAIFVLAWIALWLIDVAPTNPLPLLFVAPILLAMYFWPIFLTVFFHAGWTTGAYVRGAFKYRLRS